MNRPKIAHKTNTTLRILSGFQVIVCVRMIYCTQIHSKWGVTNQVKERKQLVAQMLKNHMTV